MQLTSAHLDALSAGAVFLATGGGGDPYTSLLATRQVLDEVGGVELLPVADVRDDDFIVTIGGVGAPSVGLELLPSVSDPLKALKLFEQHVGRGVDAVVSFEVGGGNSLIPLMAAAQRGIPVVDGDGMARALPEAQMMTYAIAGVSPTPALALDYAGNSATFSTDTTMTYERHIRAMAQAMGGMITTVEHPMSGRQLREAVVPGTISFSIELGEALATHRGNAHGMLDPLRTLFRDSLYGELFHLYTGKVVDYASAVVGGFDVGRARLEPFEGGGDEMTIDIRNEYLVARLGDRVVASVPDLITILDYETSTPINSERLRYGQRVTVVAIGCPAFYREARSLAVVSPRCFGFDFEYVPVERLQAREAP